MLVWSHQPWPQVVYLGWSLRQFLDKIELVTALGDRNSKTGRVGLGPLSCSVSRGVTGSCKSHGSQKI